MTHSLLFSLVYKIIDISASEKIGFLKIGFFSMFIAVIASLSILIASSYGGGDSSTQYVGGESIPFSIPSSRANCFLRAL